MPRIAHMQMTFAETEAAVAAKPCWRGNGVNSQLLHDLALARRCAR